MSDTRYVRTKRFAELTGYTENAVRGKIQEGVWIEGVHFRRAPDGHILVDLRAYERWVEGLTAAA